MLMFHQESFAIACLKISSIQRMLNSSFGRHVDVFSNVHLDAPPSDYLCCQRSYLAPKTKITLIKFAWLTFAAETDFLRFKQSALSISSRFKQYANLYPIASKIKSVYSICTTNNKRVAKAFKYA